MKTTLELPPELMRALKIRAAQDGRKLKDVVADALKLLLSIPASDPTASPNDVVVEAADPKTGWPIVRSLRGTPPKPLSVADSYRLVESAEREANLKHVGLPS